jgi:hypothetical protein
VVGVEFGGLKNTKFALTMRIWYNV